MSRRRSKGWKRSCWSTSKRRRIGNVGRARVQTTPPVVETDAEVSSEQNLARSGASEPYKKSATCVEDFPELMEAFGSLKRAPRVERPTEQTANLNPADQLPSDQNMRDEIMRHPYTDPEDTMDDDSDEMERFSYRKMMMMVVIMLMMMVMFNSNRNMELYHPLCRLSQTLIPCLSRALRRALRTTFWQTLNLRLKTTQQRCPRGRIRPTLI